ncbi:DUF1758 domain-containing protein [Nephila pilipes]|uniref:DUF1758 domain-containing protein n=1 Tax=Nephila pilipes TaxID=299642 RepID=A0A8X6MI55_NEPPI|nr:DUF1758 domain-containing protein [Nephila pilipes]
MSVEYRKKFVSNNKLCTNCLRLHSGACMSKYRCTVNGCKGLHNSLLRESNQISTAVKKLGVGEEEREKETNSNTAGFEGQAEVSLSTFGNKCVFTNTFVVLVKIAEGCRIKLLLLDNASILCIMREDIARKLGIKFRSANQSITGINGITQSAKYSANIEVSNRDYTFSRNARFSLLPKITDAIPVSKLNIADLNIPASIELAGSNFHMPATSTLKALADEEIADFPDAAVVISNDIYMDDVLSGESTLEGAKKLQTKISQLLVRGGFELHEWVSNSPELLKDLSASSYVLDKEFQDAPVKTLWMIWDPKVDCLTYKIPVDDWITGQDTGVEALLISLHAENIMKEAGMEMRKWISNGTTLMSQWAAEGFDTYPVDTSVSLASNKTKVLGLAW